MVAGKSSLDFRLFLRVLRPFSTSCTRSRFFVVAGASAWAGSTADFDDVEVEEEEEAEEEEAEAEEAEAEEAEAEGVADDEEEEEEEEEAEEEDDDEESISDL